MKLHFSFMSDSLKAEYPLLKQVFGPSSDWSYKAGYPRMLLPGKGAEAPGAGSIIVARAEDLPPEPGPLEGCSLVCIGSAPATYQNGSCDYVELPEGPSLLDIFEHIIRTGSRLDLWHERVMEAMVRSAEIAELYDLYLELFDNPLFFTDDVHNIIVYSENSKVLATPDIYHFLRHDIPDSDIREMVLGDVLITPTYEDTFKTAGPQIWTDDAAPYNCLYCNVITDGAYRGRILVDERARPFRLSDYALLQMLHDDMVTLIGSKSRLASSQEADIWQHLIDMLEGRNPDPEKLSLVKRNAGWEDTARFVCLVARLGERDLTIGSSFVNARLIEKALPGARALLHANTIVAIAPLPQGTSPRNLFSGELSIVVRDSLMKVGVGNEFTDLAELKAHYEQARLALDMGAQLGRTDWVLHCDDYFLPYMLAHCCGDMNHQVLCHTRLKRLMDYDASHGLDYVDTLKGYLENNCSQAEACRALFLHRSTLIQRLKRIEEITKLDLDDKSTRLYLLIYFASLGQRMGTME